MNVGVVQNLILAVAAAGQVDGPMIVMDLDRTLILVLALDILLGATR